MQHKIAKLSVLFVVLFSANGLSQAPSQHPLLDKYYPQKQSAETPKIINSQPSPTPIIKPVPVVTAATPPPPPQPSTPVPDTKTVGAVATTPAAAATLPAATSINNPVPVAQSPVAKVHVQPASPPYMDTRLGSSTKQYDTWQKNNNGAGSVTTNNK